MLGETEKSRLWDEDSSIISDRKVLPYQDRGIGFILDNENKTVHAIVVAPKQKKGENDETNDASSEKSDDEKTPCK